MELHHCVIVASPEMLVHVEAFAAASAAGEGSSVAGRSAAGAANEAAAPTRKSIVVFLVAFLGLHIGVQERNEEEITDKKRNILQK